MSSFPQPQEQDEQLPEQPPFEQDAESGQPIHFLPDFFALTIYATAQPTITIIIPIAIKSAGPILTSRYATVAVAFFSAASFLSSRSRFMIRAVRIPAKTRTIAHPTIGIQAVPKCAPVKRVPKKYTRKPTE